MVIKFDKHFLLYIYWLSLHPVAKSPDLSWRGAQLISDTHIHAHALTHIYIAWQITTKEYHIHYIVYLCLSMNHLFMKFYIVKISIRFCMKWFIFYFFIHILSGIGVIWILDVFIVKQGNTIWPRNHWLYEMIFKVCLFRHKIIFGK